MTSAEERVAWLEKQLSELDAVVRELGDELVRLRRRVEELEGRDDEPPRGGGGWEVPPHY
jgi:predicted nuclease with TOPRIM domain